jgi:7-carboxy-7-deazaguanine synthase
MKIIEIFKSISGEIGLFPQGTPVTFIRFAGCNLSCSFCDTKESRDMRNGIEVDIDRILYLIKNFGYKNIVITGGEPLLQRDDLAELSVHLMNDDYKVSVETNGTFIPDIPWIDFWVMDFKLDFMDKMIPLEKFAKVKNSAIKIVVRDNTEFEQALFIFNNLVDICEESNYKKPIFAVSAAKPMLSDQKLAEWLMDSGKEVVLNIQIHKLLGVK